MKITVRTNVCCCHIYLLWVDLTLQNMTTAAALLLVNRKMLHFPTLSLSLVCVALLSLELEEEETIPSLLPSQEKEQELSSLLRWKRENGENEWSSLPSLLRSLQHPCASLVFLNSSSPPRQLVKALLPQIQTQVKHLK